MNLYRISGIVIILGFVIYWIGNIYSPPGTYQEADLHERLNIVEAYPTRWAVSQGLGVVGIGIIFLGLLLVSIKAAGGTSPFLTYLPAGLNILSLILLVVWVRQYIADPLSSWQGEVSLFLAAPGYIIVTAGILYGLLFLRMGLPAWIAYVLIGFCVLAFSALILASPSAFFVISIYFFILLAAAVALLRYQG